MRPPVGVDRTQRRHHRGHVNSTHLEVLGHLGEGLQHPVPPGQAGVVGEFPACPALSGCGTRARASTRPPPSTATAFTDVVPISMPTVTSLATAPLCRLVDALHRLLTRVSGREMYRAEPSIRRSGGPTHAELRSRGVGAAAARPHQRHWDPDAQTMSAEQRAQLQLSRLQDLVGKVLTAPPNLFGRKLSEAGVDSVDDITSSTTSTASRPPSSRTCATARPSTRRSATTASRPCGVRSHRPVDRHDRHAHAHRLHPPRHLARVRVGGPELVAQRLASGSGRDPLPSRLPVRRRR